jgi:hypothetical protein
MDAAKIGLSSDILLIIFRHHIDASPPFWFRLAHVCRTWRQIIFASPRSLRLQLHCTYRTPVLKNLDCWPPLPLVVNYGGFPSLPPPSLEDEDNIMAALEQSDRVCSINLTVSRSLQKKLSTISKPFSVLRELVLRSQDKIQLKPLSEFLWGHHLRTLHSTGLAFPPLPRLPSQDLVDLRLHKITMPYFPPEAFANALCGMTQLRSLSLHFLFFIPRQKHLSFPPPPVGRILLPALTYFRYQGISKYLDTLVARIEAPCLRNIDITYFSQTNWDVSQLGLFINRMETWTSPLQADIVLAERAISVTFTEPGADALTRLRIQISCEQLDWQLSSISQICDQFSSFLFSVKDLRIKSVRLPSLPDDMVDEQWLRLIRAFDGTKDFYVADEIGIDIMHALHTSNEGHKSALPALQNLCVQGPILTHRPMGALLESFVSRCRLSGHPVQIFYVPWATAEEVASAKRWAEGQKRLAFNRSSFYLSYFILFSNPLQVSTGLEALLFQRARSKSTPEN